MNNILETIRIEKETVSDDEYVITEIYKDSGEEVEEGELLFSFETSKADIDVESTKQGFLYHNLSTGKTVVVGDVVAYVAGEKIENPDTLFINHDDAENKGTQKSDWDDVRVSSSAMDLINQHNLSKNDFAGYSMIRKKDVMDVVSSGSNSQPSVVKDKKPQNYDDLIIIGGRGGAKMVIEAIQSSSHHSIKGIIDDQLNKGDSVMGYPILGGEKEVFQLRDEGFRNIVLSFSSLTNLQYREERYQFFKKEGFRFPNVIHHRATIEPSVSLGEGNIILANSMVGSEVSLGNVNYVNTGAMICHESVISSNNHFAPNSVIAGRVKVGNNNLVGMCVTTYFEVEIGNYNVINNGYNVVKNIKNNEIKK